jgi:hypothetical protein
MQRKSKRKIVTKRILSSNSSSEEVVKSVKIGRIQSVQDFPTVLNDLFGNYVSECFMRVILPYVCRARWLLSKYLKYFFFAIPNNLPYQSIYIYYLYYFYLP